MGRTFEDLKAGLAEADAFMSGENTGAKVHIPAAIDPLSGPQEPATPSKRSRAPALLSITDGINDGLH